MGHAKKLRNTTVLYIKMEVFLSFQGSNILVEPIINFSPKSYVNP